MEKILIVTKDIAEFNNYQSVADKLTNRYNIFIVAEGLSLERWQQKRWPISLFPSFIVGSPSLYEKSTLMRSDISPRNTINMLRPDLIMTGLASPINLGEEFGLAANEAGIPLGYIEDLWGVHTRSKAKPDFVCTVDAYGASLVEKYYNGKTKCFVTGAPSDDILLGVEAHPEVEAVVKKTPYTVLVAGQDHSTTPLLAGLLSFLEGRGNYTIIPRFHPKWLAVTEETVAAETDPVKKKTAEGIFSACNQWRSMLGAVKNGTVWWAPSHITTHQITKSVPYVVSIYSNVLREAGILGAVPVSWTSDIGREMMQKHMGGLERYPLVQYGAVIEVETPKDYLRCVPNPDTPEYRATRAIIKQQLRTDGKNTERVVQAIEQYL
ncbi:MAG: hypothetical protein Q7R73_03460 [bacterium]|nr:hypothetical protein [bacterium]